MKTLSRWMRSAADGLLDLVYPPHCVACGQAGAWLCDGCIESIPWIVYPFCPRCGRPQRDGTLCPVCSLQPSYVASMRSLSPHKAPLRQAVHGLKYEGVRELAPTLGALLARGCRRYGLAADVIVPVPLHPARERRRGYNQAALLADALGREVGIPVDGTALVRVRDTASQVGLSGAERRRNVNGAFEARASVQDVHILLIDDVYTTGATLQASGAALLQAGASEVSALTLTRALDPETRRLERALSQDA